MIIEKIKYSRYLNSAREWRIVGKDDIDNEDYADFGNINLFIGKNAAGKSRALVAIYDLAALIAGKQTVENTTYHTQAFDFIFDHDGDKYRYILQFEERNILEEKLFVNGAEVLNRKNGFLLVNGQKIDVSSNIFASQLLIGHKNPNKSYYFQELINWGCSLRRLRFSDEIEKNKYIETLEVLKDEDSRVDDLGVIIPVFYWGQKLYGQTFVGEILECMNELGYDLTDIEIKKNRQGYCINVEESGRYKVSQQEMSQGMFRAFAFFSLLIFAKRRDLSICILIDDIGEGLDHERSKSLINMVIRKVYNTQIQYFMSTNDRYVMNMVHLKYWSIIERIGSKAVFYNIENSQKNFEDFKYTGLNNFDFFTTDFYRDGYGDDVLEEELDEEENNQ